MANVGMTERRDRPYLLLEPPHESFVGWAGGGQNLQRDVPPESLIPRSVHFAHTAGAEEGQDSVVIDRDTREIAHWSAVNLLDQSTRVENRSYEKFARAFVKLQQGLHFFMQGFVAMAQLREFLSTQRGVKIENGMKDGLNLLPAIGRHET